MTVLEALQQGKIDEFLEYYVTHDCGTWEFEDCMEVKDSNDKEEICSEYFCDSESGFECCKLCRDEKCPYNIDRKEVAKRQVLKWLNAEIEEKP